MLLDEESFEAGVPVTYLEGQETTVKCRLVNNSGTVLGIDLHVKFELWNFYIFNVTDKKKFKSLETWPLLCVV